METHTVTATARPESGKGSARKARAAGKTPGILYVSGGEGTPISFELGQLAAIFRKTNDPNTVVTVVLGDTTQRALVREIQRNPVTREVEHVDFFGIDDGTRVLLEVALVPVGRAAGTRAGGTFRMLTRRAKIECAAEAIPKSIEFDISELGVQEFFKASMLKVPDGARVVYRQDFNVATVEGKRVSKEQAAADAAAAEAAAKGAPKAKAKPAAKAAAKAAPAKAPGK
jgi:large subunit ribosomal protein L25